MATYRVGASAGPVAVADGAVWVPNTGEGTVSRIDINTNTVVAVVRVGDLARLQQTGCGPSSVHSFMRETFLQRRCDLPSAIATTDGTVWVGANDEERILQIDPRTNAVVASIPLGVPIFRLAARLGVLWVTDYEDDLILRVDPQTRQVVATIHDPAHGPSAVAADDDGVWVADSRADAVTRIDPRSGQVVAVIPVGRIPLPLVTGHGSVWVRNEGDATVSRLDPRTNRSIATVRVAEHAGRDGSDGIAVDAGGVWISGLFLARIDPETDTVTARLPHPAISVAVGLGSLWVTDLVGTVSRIQPPG